MDDLQAMAVFAAVVRLGSMSGAARQLGMTPSAVSQRVRALEAAHGVILLHRSTRKLRLTEVGQRVHAHCEALVHSAAQAREQLQLARDALEGELRLAAPVGFARHVGPALAPLLAQHPALKLRLLVDDQMIDLIEARIDLALRAGRMPDSSWVARRLCSFGWSLCAAPAYLARAGMPQRPADLAQHEWLGGDTRSEGGLMIELTGGDGAVERLRVEPRVVSNNQLTIQQLCATGLGLALLVRPDADDDLRAGRLVPLLSEWRLPTVPVWAVTPQREAQPAKVRHALAALQAVLRQLPGSAD
ncbi:LysR family transcriptional regulator [Aquincola sp. S2]|uniref:LysR family transcriptional regulator n=1 Tax=Pseudaquabacterium terrae TaxID=2732868 RepID=A0ABX2EQF0_9BURK|nr:LysR family transcriptional regulator [Aquabacterium terrae]NRF70838.1 LysR family transcriptional regulator [Aquabacterium terrae]